MSEANPANESRIVPVYFRDQILDEIESAEAVLKPLGHTRNFIISEATSAGLPKILKRLKDKPASGTFTDLVEAICRELPDQEITTQLVTDKLLELKPELKDSSSLGNVSKFLERLSERGILRAGKLQGRKKVWHLIKEGEVKPERAKPQSSRSAEELANPTWTCCPYHKSGADKSRPCSTRALKV